MNQSGVARDAISRSTAETPQLDELFRIFCGAALVGSALILFGWQIDEPTFKAGAPGLRATQPMGAVLQIVAALAMGLSAARNSQAKAASRLLGLALLALSLLVIVQNAFDVDWGTDRLLFADEVVTEQTGPYLRPGRPEGAALLAFLALGWCLLTAQVRKRGMIRSYLAAAQVGLLGSTIALIAYGLNIAPLYVMGLYVQASLPGSFILWLLFACAVIHRRDQGFLSTLAGDSLGAISARSILAWSGCLLVVLVAVVQVASHAHWYRSELVVLFVIITGFATLLLGLTAHVNRLDFIDQRRQDVLEQARALRVRAAAATDAHADSLSDKRQLVSNLAHELRNPLAALSLTRELLQNEKLTSEQRTAAHLAMERQIRRLRLIVDESLANYDETRSSAQVSSPSSAEHPQPRQ